MRDSILAWRRIKMVTFSDDADILKYEPILFGELHLPWQVLATGTGASLSGTTLTASSVDFIAAQVQAGGVVYLQSADGSLDGAYEIVSVDSATQLSISVVRADSTDTAVSPPAATNISYRISTFGPQTAEVGFQLTEYFGIRPGNPASEIDADDILDTTVLRLASVFAVICNVSRQNKGSELLEQKPVLPEALRQVKRAVPTQYRYRRGRACRRYQDWSGRKISEGLVYKEKTDESHIRCTDVV
jgi:hypothetical protein